MKRNINLILLCAGFIFLVPTGLQASLVRFSLDEFYRLADEYVGTPYLWGGNDEDGIDCSGLACALYSGAFGIDLPRVVRDQVTKGIPVKGALMPGDLVFFNTTGVVSHVGVYLGGNQFIQASSWAEKSGVVRSSLEEPYNRDRFTGARRFFTWEQESPAEKGESWDFSFSRSPDKQAENFRLNYYLDGKRVKSKIKRASKGQGVKDRVFLSEEGTWTAVLFNTDGEITALEALIVGSN